ncbi:hypothetical protein YPPY48_1461, partial [Yersinia pestis PY-48]|jgi:hypothetical protein
MPCW